MKFIVLVLIFVVPHAFSKTRDKKNPPKTCVLPGEPIHWEADYCMYKSGTDDFHSDTVQKCVDNENTEIWKIKDACEKKKAFKKKMCGFLSKSKHPAFDRICVKNEAPSSVAAGGVEL